MDTLRKDLEDLGATHVVTYDELQDKKAIKAMVKEWTNGQVFIPPYRFRTSLLIRVRKGYPSRVKLCWGESTSMAGLLGTDAHLVTYGAMAKRPLTLPASFLIFKNLTSHGFWLSRWYKDNGEGQSRLVGELARAMASGKVSGLINLIGMALHVSKQFKEPRHEIIEMGEKLATRQQRVQSGRYFKECRWAKSRKKSSSKLPEQARFANRNPYNVFGTYR